MASQLLIIQPQYALLEVMPQKGFSAILVVVLMVILAALVLGGIYYYTEIYHPQNYAKAIIPLFENLEKEIQTSQNQTLKDSKDYLGAIEMLEDQQTLFQKKKDELDSLKPPKKMRELHHDFQKTLDLIIYAGLDARKIANFANKANKLYDILKPKDEPKDKTVGAFVQFWDNRIAQAKILAQDLFQEKPPKADQLQFDKLKATWQETAEGYDAALNYLKRQDPNMLVSNVSDNIPSEEKAKISKADKIDEFLSMLEDVTRADANEFIKFNFTATLAGEEVNQLGSRVSNAIKELKEKYQK